MSRMSMADLRDFTPDAVLDAGRYTHEIGPNTKINEKDDGRISLQVELKVIEGPTQSDGSEPEGRSSFTFFPLNNFANMKDQGAFCKRNLNSFTTATGVDFDPADFDPEELAQDLVGLQVVATNKIRPDMDGEPSEDWKKWKEAE
jgi:hypothetical protein